VYEYICDGDKQADFWADDKCLEKVQTFGDVFKSQINHYKHVNGRFIVHTIEQSFCGVIGLDTYYVINALMFALLCVYCEHRRTYTHSC
jgi:hypothetical protein